MTEETQGTPCLSFQDRLRKALGPVPDPALEGDSVFKLALSMIREATQVLRDVARSKNCELQSWYTTDSSFSRWHRRRYRLAMFHSGKPVPDYSVYAYAAGTFVVSEEGWPVSVLVNGEWEIANSKKELEDALLLWIGSRDLREYVLLVGGGLEFL